MDTHQPDRSPPASPDPDRPSFPIVGIGASAGSFPALAALLRHLPPAPGMAFVVVLHLPPNQQSKADRVLQGWTDMPVIQVGHAMPVLPDQVYVIPPGRELAMRDSTLVPQPLENIHGARTTIDVFFRALGMAHRERAIGVILSGMGSDGTAGLACIKEKGGVTIVQLPEDAEEASMPRTAIDSGMADFVLAAAEIPLKLVELGNITREIRQHAARGQAAAGAPFDMGPDPRQALADVLSLLHEHTGHDFREYKEATLLRRLERRLQVRGKPDLPTYRDLLREDAAEAHALLKDLLIGVTRFFRDREAFAALDRTVLPEILRNRKPDDPVRVWVAACSTGEEAYSLAMLLADHAAGMAEPPPIQVFASDIDTHAIRAARAGIYPASIAQDVPAERLQRYFTLDNGNYKVRKALREYVMFAEHNLLRDPAFSAVDLVTCRNFLIYLNRQMHRHLLGRFHFALNPGGYLMLGIAETAEDGTDLFAPAVAASHIYKALPASAGTTAPPRIAMPSARRPAPGRHEPAPYTAQRGRLFSFAEIRLHKAAELAPPSILASGDGEVVHVTERASRYLRLAGGEPTRDLVALVAPELRPDLRAALFQARTHGQPVSTGPVRYDQDGEGCTVDITVLPFLDGHADEPLLLVAFRAVDAAPAVPAPAGPRDHSLVSRLDEELQQTRLRLRDTVDQADQASVAMRTAIEELQTSVQELSLANDDLIGRNEELRAANIELHRRLETLTKAHDDLDNLVASSDVATLFLDREMRILRYTPRITGLFNLIPADVGRPLLHITNKLDRPQLAQDAATVFQTLQPMEQEVRARDGRYYIVRVHPYRTLEDRIDGAVMTFFDITERRAGEEALREADARRAFLLAFSDALRAQPDERAIKEEATRMLAAHLCLDRCWVSEVFEEDGYSTVGPEQVRPGLPPMTGTFRLADYPGTMLQLTTQPMVIADAANDARFGAAEKQLLAALQLASLLVIPLRKGPRHVIWALAAAMATPRHWTDAERALLEDVAERTWAAAERMRTEATLRASEERYRTLFETMGQGYCHLELVRDAHGRAMDLRYLECNPAFERFFGIPVEQAEGRLASEVFPQLESWWIETFDRIARSGQPERVRHEVASLGRGYDVSVYPRGVDRLVVLYDEVSAA